jgi:hypothetical protein
MNSEFLGRKSMAYRRSILICLIVLLVTTKMQVVKSAPMALFSDPAITHNVWGAHSPTVREDQHHCRFYITPFYQCAPHRTGAYNKCGTKVPTGNRLGSWNMLSLFFGSDVSPKTFDATNYPFLHEAYTEIQAAEDTAGIGHPYTVEEEYQGEDTVTGHYDVPVSYEKMGIRFGLIFTADSGFGFAVKTGISEYVQKPEYIITTSDVAKNVAQNAVDKYLMDPAKRIKIARELGFKKDIERYCATEFEDIHFQLHWAKDFPLENEDGDHVVSIIPYLALGAWLPTGRKRHQDIMFSLPTGNDDFIGISTEAALNLEFFDEISGRVRPTVQIGLGGGATFFETRELENYRVPSSVFQTNLIPWKTTVRRRLGTVWNFYATLKASPFMDGLSFYADYILTHHKADSIRVKDPELVGGEVMRETLFKSEILEEQSVWRSQTIQAGCDYLITNNLSLAAGFQAQITGKRVYRSTTVFGQVTFWF